MLAVDRDGAVVDGDELIALAALHLRRAGRLPGDGVAVTVMTNYGFHTAMREAGVEVATTAVGDRYVLEALRERGWALGGEQSGHIIDMGFVPSGDGIAAALLTLESLEGGDLADRHAMEKLPQRLVNVRRSAAGSWRPSRPRVDAGATGPGRRLSRPRLAAGPASASTASAPATGAEAIRPSAPSSTAIGVPSNAELVAGDELLVEQHRGPEAVGARRRLVPRRDDDESRGAALFAPRLPGEQARRIARQWPQPGSQEQQERGAAAEVGEPDVPAVQVR